MIRGLPYAAAAFCRLLLTVVPQLVARYARCTARTHAYRDAAALALCAAGFARAYPLPSLPHGYGLNAFCISRATFTACRFARDVARCAAAHTLALTCAGPTLLRLPDLTVLTVDRYDWITLQPHV